MYMYVVFFLNYFYLNKLIDIIFLKFVRLNINLFDEIVGLWLDNKFVIRFRLDFFWWEV